MRLLALILSLLAMPLAAQQTAVSRDEGLAAWDRIFAVAQHPRCTNCHVGPQEAPMWEGLSYGAGRRHGMNVLAGESRIGAETIPCRTCHITSDAPNLVPGAAPRILEAWRLPPVELDWLNRTSAELCADLRDPERNDGHDIDGLVNHLLSSPFVAWGFAPGAGRSAPPGSPETMAEDVALWGAAGAPCVGD